MFLIVSTLKKLSMRLISYLRLLAFTLIPIIDISPLKEGHVIPLRVYLKSEQVLAFKVTNEEWATLEGSNPKDAVLHH